MNTIEMNPSTTIKNMLCSEWDDSSQNSESFENNLVNEITPESNAENSAHEESIQLEVSSNKNVVENTGESLESDAKNSDNESHKHSINEDSISDSEKLAKQSSSIDKPENKSNKKKRGRKPTSKDTPCTSLKRKIPTKKKNTKKSNVVDESETSKSPVTGSNKKVEKSITLNHDGDSDDEADTRKSSEVDEPKANQLPSVYSRKQIAKHAKRINNLKALEENEDSDSETDTDAALDRDLDINFRIFEESIKSVNKVVVGEIQCNILDDQSCAEVVNSANKNAVNVFQFTVNTNCAENCDNNDSHENLTSKDTSSTDNIEDIALSDEPLEFSDNDSDLEILVSKPIIRKRASQYVKKEKSTEKKQKLTMYDLIHDNGPFSPELKEDTSDTDQKEDIKVYEAKKTKTTNKNFKPKKEEPIEDDKEMILNTQEKNQNLPVPKLKVGADGEVIIDMDSLVIEQTGVSEARSALANSEVIEECSLSYTSYNKKNSFRKQWTPHETLKFYQVLSTIGTDFTLMATLFPGRTRKCMKRKFKREEKTNADLILKALSCKQSFNINLLEKELQLKDEKVNQLKENSKKQKPVKRKAAPKKEPKCKRKSFFESSISSFQSGKT